MLSDDFNTGTVSIPVLVCSGRRAERRVTYCEEDPLQHLAVLVRARPRVERELELGVVVLLEVEKDRGGLEDGEVVAVAVDEDGDATVRVHPDKPWLLLRPLPDIYRMHTFTAASESPAPRHARGSNVLVFKTILVPKLLEEDRNLPAIGGPSGIELEGLACRRRCG